MSEFKIGDRVNQRGIDSPGTLKEFYCNSTWRVVRDVGGWYFALPSELVLIPAESKNSPLAIGDPVIISIGTFWSSGGDHQNDPSSHPGGHVRNPA